MNTINHSFLSIEQATEKYLHETEHSPNNKQVTGGYSFQDMLAIKEASVKKDLVFSKHAMNRLQERNIDLTKEQMNRLQEGTEKANKKGINESLVMVDDLAFIVSVKNRTVITAVDQMESKENIFTNIDGAVIN